MSGERSSRRAAGAATLILVMVVAAWLAATVAWRPLSLPDEGRYVGVAWEMLRSGDWAVPTLDGLPYFHKPPLFYWITAAALGVGGVHPWSGRVASWLAALVAAIALYHFVRRWGGDERARAALMALVTQPLFYGAAQYANLDMLVAACIGVAILAFADATLRLATGELSRTALAVAYLSCALGVLAKGLIGVVLPLLVIGAWTLLREGRSAPRLWRRLLWWPGLLAFAAIVLPWFVAMQQRFPGFADYFFLVQHVRRFAAGGFNNTQPFWFYAAVVPLLTLPWTPWAWAWRQRAFWRDAEHGALRRLMATWALVVLLFFSLPQSKLVGYVVPLSLPLACLFADACCSSPWRGARRAWAASVIAGVLLCPVAVVLAARHDTSSSAALASVLLAQRSDAEPLIFIDRYPFDLPMLAHHGDVTVAIDDWQSPALQMHDDWRKELVDAARFASPERAGRLINRDHIGGALCGANAAWIVAPSSTPPPWLSDQPPMASNADTALWRVSGAMLDHLSDCRRTPNDGPIGK